MNKTLLLIICDFLLLNLLALTRWDAPVATPVQQQAPLSSEHKSAPISKDQDLVEVMKLSLQDEQARRDELAQQLQSTVQQLQTSEQSIQARDKTLAQLEAEKAKLATNLDTTQRNITQLSRDVDAAKQDAGMSKERLAQMQRELDRREAELAREKTQVSKLEQQQSQAQERIENLNAAVKVAEQEKVMLRETTDVLKSQVEAERTDRIRVQETTTQLAQGVGNLAEKSSDLTKEIRENRPINANTLFSEYMANNVQVRFETVRPGLFGSSPRTLDVRTILASDGKDTYAIFHINDTPFSLTYPGADISRIVINLSKGDYHTRASQMHFLALDPRIIVVPLTPEQVAGLGVKAYMTSLEPFKFSDAMLISNGGAKYEETPFKLDPTQPTFVQMRVSFFASKRGDLVISKSGELLGIMVNKDYCALVNNFLPTKTILAGEDTSKQGIGSTLNALNSRVQSLPLKLQ